MNTGIIKYAYETGKNKRLRTNTNNGKERQNRTRNGLFFSFLSRRQRENFKCLATQKYVGHS